MLTPSEALGLSGAALAARVRRAVHTLPDAALARIAGALRDDARAQAVVYEHAGIYEPVRVMPRPLLAMPDQRSYVHHVCTTLNDALKRLPDLYLRDPDVRSILRIRADEDALLRATWSPEHARNNPVYGRLDAVCDFESAAWQHSLWFLEPNLSGVGGIHFAPLAEQLVMRDVVPALLATDDTLAISLPRDQRDLFLGVLLEHAESLGRTGRTIALVEPKYEHDGPNEQPVLARYLRERHGAEVVHVDPRELRVEGGEVYYGDVCVDVAYRDYETRDLLALERSEGRPLAAMRALFAQNRVVSSLVGDFDHKGCWEVLTDDALAARFFSMEQRRTFRRHVLWTRLMRERRCELPSGHGELAEYVRSHREQLVLKPNRGYGGAGVLMGHATSQAEWEAQLAEALALADDPERAWVVQAATRLPVYDFPVVDDAGRVHEQPFYAVMGFAATDDGLGILCRVSQKQVVNVAQRGGLAAVLVGAMPQELATPRRPRARGERAREELAALVREVRHLDQAIGLLGWDEETYLPAEGRRDRGAQVGTLEALRHGILHGDRLGDLLHEAAALPDTSADQDTELRVLTRLRKAALALPDDLVRAHAEARSRCLAAWELAREDGNYAAYAPQFAQLLGLVRERARCLAGSGDPYDALLDEHEPGLTRARLEPTLAELGGTLRELVARCARPADPSEPSFRGRVIAAPVQLGLCRAILGQVGFSFARGRLDLSSHPFTLSAGCDDVRLTIRVDEGFLPTALFATLHEGGHGLYDQGFDAADRDSLLADAPSMGLHEAQARLWENAVGRSAAFWEGLFPQLQTAAPDALRGLDAERAYRAVNRVSPSLNRVESDEVSYNLHIVLRYELELGLLNGSLSAADLPGAWEDRCQTLFGLRPRHVAEGCLQDVHWSLGSFGYFPTYTVGNLYAAQLVDAYARTHDLDAELRGGRWLPLSHWLRDHIHRKGQRQDAEGLVRALTGEGLSARAFLASVARKHG